MTGHLDRTISDSARPGPIQHCRLETGPVRSTACCTFTSVVISLALCVLWGCGGADIPDDRPDVVPVSGVVLHNGNPVEEAHVTFVSSSDEQAKAAFGRTDGQGRFKLTTFSTNDGAVLGEHVVTVSKFSSSEDSGEDVVSDEGNRTVEVESLIPEQYSKLDQSGLTATVTAGGDNEFMFELE